MRNFKWILFLLAFGLILELFQWMRDEADRWPFFDLMVVLVCISQFVHFLIELFFKRYRSALQSLLGSLLIFFAFLKVGFIYYNVFAHLLIVVSSLIFFIKIKDEDLQASFNKKYILLPFMILSSFAMLISDSYILSLIHSQTQIVYSDIDDLSWSDFKGNFEEQEVEVDGTKHIVDAVIESKIFCKINEVYNYPQIICVSAMIPEESFTRSSDTVLLKHEKVHFSISELYACKIRELNNQWPSDIDLLKEKSDNLYSISNKVQVEFDRESEHCSNRAQELIWEKKIDSLLKTY